MRLRELLREAGYCLPETVEDREITGVTSDSRAVERGNVFVALRGLHRNGLDYAPQALARGAAFVVCEENAFGYPCMTVESARAALARLLDAWYGHPSRGLGLIGITGTNGKTTTATMLYYIMRRAGYRCGLIGTVCCALEGRELTVSRADPLANMTTPDPEALFAWQFIQYEFHRQWDRVHQYAKEHGVKIIGDIPFYVSLDSYDVSASPDQFLLDERYTPTHVAGVPPDYFSEDGQLWGNPLYSWESMERDGYRWWCDRLGYMLSLFDGVRIDHFRAISAFWSIPKDAKTAKEGHWEKGPANKLIDAFAPLAKGKLILAENLGMIDDDTNALLAYSGYPGMAVFQFGFDGNPLSPHLPHNYTENLVAYTGTHDNNTLLGFLWELDEDTRENVLDYLGEPEDGFDATIRALMMSAAGTVIFPVQDLLGFGADTRINTPGKADGNWRYRVTAEQLANVNWRRFAHLNRLSARI